MDSTFYLNRMDQTMKKKKKKYEKLEIDIRSIRLKRKNEELQEENEKLKKENSVLRQKNKILELGISDVMIVEIQTLKEEIFSLLEKIKEEEENTAKLERQISIFCPHCGQKIIEV